MSGAPEADTPRPSGGPDKARATGPASGPWYRDGLRFSCTACGKCCENHGDGFSYVYSTRKERAMIAAHLDMSLRAFERTYCEEAGGALSFKSENEACVFLADGRCSIYTLRPAQCRTFPFWPELLRDEDTWQRDVASFCPGADQGDLHDVDTIRATMRASG